MLADPCADPGIFARVVQVRFAGRPIVARVWMLADPCADPGIFARVVQARLPENSSDNVFCLFFSMVYFKENFNLTRFRGGVQPFPGGGSKC